MAIIKTKRKSAKKQPRCSKSINVRLTQDQWQEVTTWADRAKLEPCDYVKKVLLDFLNVSFQ
jgi:hypothetical protein